LKTNSLNSSKIKEVNTDQENSLIPLLQGFDELWQATELSLPSYQDLSDLAEKDKKDYSEQILFLTDENNLLRNENFALKQEMVDLIQKNRIYEKIAQDYSHLMDLNRLLTKQLNSLMVSREKEKHQLSALKELLS
jgi:hypothetical protein